MGVTLWDFIDMRNHMFGHIKSRITPRKHPAIEIKKQFNSIVLDDTFNCRFQLTQTSPLRFVNR